MAEIAAHSEMQNERAPVIKRDNQILAAAVCVDKATSSQSVCKRSSSRTPDDVRSGDDYSLDALAESSSPKVLKLGFYFGKLRHEVDRGE